MLDWDHVVFFAFLHSLFFSFSPSGVLVWMTAKCLAYYTKNIVVLQCFILGLGGVVLLFFSMYLWSIAKKDINLLIGLIAVHCHPKGGSRRKRT